MHDIFRGVCQASADGLVASGQPQSLSNLLSSERMSRAMFKYWFEANQFDRSFEPLFNRMFDMLASSSQGIDIHDMVEALALLTKADPEKRARFAFSAYDLNGDGIVDSHDVFLVLQMGHTRVLANDILALSHSVGLAMEDKQKQAPAHEVGGGNLHTQKQHKREVSPVKRKASVLLPPLVGVGKLASLANACRDDGTGDDDDPDGSIALEKPRRLSGATGKSAGLASINERLQRMFNGLLSSREKPVPISAEDFWRCHNSRDDTDLVRAFVDIFYHRLRDHVNVRIHPPPRLEHSKTASSRWVAQHPAGAPRSTRHVPAMHLPLHAGLLTKTEMLHLEQRFALVAQNQACLGSMEFRSLLLQLIELDAAPVVFFDLLFAAFDRCGHGKVSLEDCATALGDIIRGSPTDRKRLVFGMLDLDGNGFITSSELFFMLDSEMGVILRDDLEPLLDLLVAKYMSDRTPSSDEMLVTFEEFAAAVSDSPHALWAFRKAEQLLQTPIDQ